MRTVFSPFDQKVKRAVVVCALFLIAVGSWGFTLTHVSRYQEHIVLSVSDFVAAASLPYRVMKLSREPADTELVMPVEDIRPQDVADTWGALRSGGRTHQGIDIFAQRGTPVYSATDGYIVRTGTNRLGGTYVFVIGAGGVRYYYAHLNDIADGIKTGKKVTTDTVIGYVGNTGNAATTDPHLHFGMYTPKGPQNPYELFVDRS